jgi:phage tail-like protein
MTSAVTQLSTLATNGNVDLRANGYVPQWMEQRSRLLQYLPGIFSEGEESSFIGRYLLIFETILDSVDITISQLPAYFAADTAPEEFLPWLASWLGIVIDEGWPVGRRRAVLANAMELHRWRGTIRGLSEHLLLYTGIKPEIIEGGSGFKLDPKSKLGHQIMLGGGDRSNHFSVVLHTTEPDTLDRARLRAVIEVHRPAHATYGLFVLSPEDEQVATGGSRREPGEGAD